MELLTPHELAAHLKVSPATIHEWSRLCPDMPRLRAGRLLRYQLPAVIGWLERGGPRGIKQLRDGRKHAARVPAEDAAAPTATPQKPNRVGASR